MSMARLLTVLNQICLHDTAIGGKKYDYFDIHYFSSLSNDGGKLIGLSNSFYLQRTNALLTELVWCLYRVNYPSAVGHLM